MGTRLELQDKLKEALGSDQVFFQPPKSVQMKYPCIVYERNNADTEFADNASYIYRKRYTITVIDKNPDSAIPDSVAKFPYCIEDRWFSSDNLNHWVFNLYY